MYISETCPNIFVLHASWINNDAYYFISPSACHYPSTASSPFYILLLLFYTLSVFGWYMCTGNSLLNQASAKHSPACKIHTVIMDDWLVVYSKCWLKQSGYVFPWIIMLVFPGHISVAITHELCVPPSWTFADICFPEDNNYCELGALIRSPGL